MNICEKCNGCGWENPAQAVDRCSACNGSGVLSKKRFIVWRNEEKTIGVIVEEYQLAYELRKGSMNSLGIVDGPFMDAWGDLTADDVCIIEEVQL